MSDSDKPLVINVESGDDAGKAQGRRRYRYWARLTRNGAIAVRGMNRRNPNEEMVMFLSEWEQLGKFLGSKGFEAFVSKNRESLRVREERSSTSGRAPREPREPREPRGGPGPRATDVSGNPTVSVESGVVESDTV